MASPSRFRAMAASAGALAGMLWVQGCEVKYSAFDPVNPALLQSSLKVGVSTRADVQAVLGAPTGAGRAMLPFEPKPRTLWSYWYEEGSTKASGRTVMYVYFDKDKYAGYMWFSSLPPKGATSK